MILCFECGVQGGLHDHHVVPRSRGGTQTVALCEACHSLVHGRDLSISRLTSEAMRAKRERGEYTGGRVRHGYRVSEDGGALEPHAGERAALKVVRELRAEGLSYRAISRKLARRGMRSRTGRAYTHNAVRNMLDAVLRDEL